MAFRYLRHGLYTRRKPLATNGFEPFIDNLMWTVTHFHYQYYFNNVSRHAILTNQTQLEKILNLATSADYSGSALDAGPNPCSPGFLRIGIPSIVPYRKQTNPFCPNSNNRTGFQFQHRVLLKYPRPMKSRRLAITDLQVPQFPKHC